MERNGRNSCTGNSRHINVRYFWIKHKIDQGEVKVEYLQSHLMIADFFTKPLVSALFHKLRGFIMGWRPMSDLKINIDGTRNKEDVEIPNCEQV